MKNSIGLGFMGLMLLVSTSAQAEEATVDARDARAALRAEIASPIQGEFAVGNSFSYSSSGNYTKGDMGGYSGNGFIEGGGQAGTYPVAPGGSGSGGGTGTIPSY